MKINLESELIKSAESYLKLSDRMRGIQDEPEWLTGGIWKYLRKRGCYSLQRIVLVPLSL